VIKVFQNDRGFTFLELMIALGILMILVSFVELSKSNTINALLRSRRMTVVATLLKNKMIETENEFQGKPFNELKTEETGDFKGEDYQDYKWSREVKELEFPDLSKLFNKLTGAGGEDGESTEGSGNQIQDQAFKSLTEYLTKTIRVVSVSVIWDEGQGARQQTVNMYLVDLKSEPQLPF